MIHSLTMRTVFCLLIVLRKTAHWFLSKPEDTILLLTLIPSLQEFIANLYWRSQHDADEYNSAQSQSTLYKEQFISKTREKLIYSAMELKKLQYMKSPLGSFVNKPNIWLFDGVSFSYYTYIWTCPRYFRNPIRNRSSDT